MKESRSNDLLSGAQSIEVFNSGLEVWLYDRSHRDELKASGAFEETADVAALEKAMKGFVQKGKIMAYGLMQDDSLNIAVVVREPFTKRELTSARWLAPQKAFLRLPSGLLVIESNDALTIRQSNPTDPGAELEVPAGDYLATLYRIDWDGLEADEIEWHGPSEIIVLTPGEKAKPVRGQPAILPWEPAGPGKIDWKIESGIYEGAVVFHDDEMAMSIALDAAGVSKLALKDKSVALLSAPSLSFECVLVLAAGDKTKAEYYDRLEKLRPPAAFAGKQWAHCQLDMEPGSQTVFCLRRNSKTLVSKKQQNTWIQATMRILDQQALEKR
jgi:hypothetical protein